MKHFKNIPMADLEIVLVSSSAFSIPLSLSLSISRVFIVLIAPFVSQKFCIKLVTCLVTFSFEQPEKKNPGLTPMDWVKFLASAVLGLVRYLISIIYK